MACHLSHGKHFSHIYHHTTKVSLMTQNFQKALTPILASSVVYISHIFTYISIGQPSDSIWSKRTNNSSHKLNDHNENVSVPINTIYQCSEAMHRTVGSTDKIMPWKSLPSIVQVPDYLNSTD